MVVDNFSGEPNTDMKGALDEKSEELNDLDNIGNEDNTNITDKEKLAKEEADKKLAEDKMTDEEKLAKEEADKKAKEEEDKNNEEIVLEPVKLPEGVEIDTELQTELFEFAKERKMKQEDVQAIADMAVKMDQKRIERVFEQILQERKAWVEEAKKDPDIGGSNWDTSVAMAKRGLDKVGNDYIKEVLRVTGYGSNVHFIKMFNEIGKMFSEDKSASNNSSNDKPANISREKRLYPDMI